MEKAGEMFQCFMMQTALPEDPSSAPNIYALQLTTACKSSSRGFNTLFWPLQTLHLSLLHYFAEQFTNYDNYLQQDILRNFIKIWSLSGALQGLSGQSWR